MKTIDNHIAKKGDVVWEIGVTTEGVYRPTRSVVGAKHCSNRVINKNKTWHSREACSHECDKLNKQQREESKTVAFTWGDLAIAISKMPTDQRQKPVWISIDDESKFRHVTALEYMPHDIYVNKENDEDCGPIEDLKLAHGEDFVENDYQLTTPEGTPYLADDY
jgi:hypothetical protein